MGYTKWCFFNLPIQRSIKTGLFTDVLMGSMSPSRVIIYWEYSGGGIIADATKRPQNLTFAQDDIIYHFFSHEICFMASFTTICGNNPSQTSGGPWKRRVVSREKTQAPGKRPDLCAKRVRLWYQTNHSRYISFRSMVNGYLLIVERSFGKRMRTTHLHMIC